jgi:hypothetical protein
MPHEGFLRPSVNVPNYFSKISFFMIPFYLLLMIMKNNIGENIVIISERTETNMLRELPEVFKDLNYNIIIINIKHTEERAINEAIRNVRYCYITDLIK